MKDRQEQEVKEFSDKRDIKPSKHHSVVEGKFCQIFPLRAVNESCFKNNMSYGSSTRTINKIKGTTAKEQMQILFKFSTEFIGENFNHLKTNFLKKFGENFTLKRENRKIYLQLQCTELITTLEFIYSIMTESIVAEIPYNSQYKSSNSFGKIEVPISLQMMKPFAYEETDKNNRNQIEYEETDKNNKNQIEYDYSSVSEYSNNMVTNDSENRKIEISKYQRTVENSNNPKYQTASPDLKELDKSEHQILNSFENSSSEYEHFFLVNPTDFMENKSSFHSLRIFSFTCLNFLLMKILHIQKYHSLMELYRCTDESNYTEPFIFTVSGPNVQSVNSFLNEIKELYYRSVLIQIKDSKAFSFDQIDNMNSNKELNSKEIKTNNYSYIHITNGNGTNILFSEIGNLTFNSNFNAFISIKIENEIGDFICGKKLGKLFKMNCSGLKVFILDSQNTFERENPEVFSTEQVNFYQIFDTSTLEKPAFIFEMEGTITECLTCYSNILDEFPTEILFCVDSKHHKKIIGAGGFAIQRIMKKHNVYIKFFNDRDSEGLIGNVLIKTPRKNQEQMEYAKIEILKMIGISQKESEGNEEYSVEKETPFKKIQELLKMNLTKNQMD